MLQINAGAYLIEAANPRHEHEWQVWQDVKLPDDKILVPGVVSHCIHLVEHPELVAQRIVRFAERGRARAGHRRHRLRLRHVRRRRRGAPRGRVGEAARAGRGGAARRAEGCGERNYCRSAGATRNGVMPRTTLTSAKTNTRS